MQECHIGQPAMDLNYHHLRYFWAVAHEGSVARASGRLRVAMPTISGQVKQLERSIGGSLFQRVGRHLELTDLGRHVYGYAEQIFDVGDELIASLRGQPGTRAIPFTIGVANVVPKLLAYRLIEPALHLDREFTITVTEGEPDRLLADLAIHRLDLVISDAPIPPHVNVRAFNHRLGSSAVGIFAVPGLARKLKRRFPRSLHERPFLAPAAKSTLSRELERWFDQQDLRPRIVGRFENSALLKVFASQGHGAFAAPISVADHLEEQFGAVFVGPIEGVTDRSYAISVERRITHPAVSAISKAARTVLD